MGPKSVGLRTEAVGKQLYAYDIHEIAGVPYARLVPLRAEKPEWVRVREADGSQIYCNVINLVETPANQDSLVKSLNNMAQAINNLAAKDK